MKKHDDIDEHDRMVAGILLILGLYAITVLTFCFAMYGLVELINWIGTATFPSR